MDFLSELKHAKEHISNDLLLLSDSLIENYPTIGPFNRTVIPELTEFANRGKMVRGSLLFLLTEERDTIPQSAILRLASILELIHSGVLIHDDIIDRDQKRRGEPSTWARYRDELAIKDVQYGTSQAICVGDVSFFVIIEELAKLTIPDEIKIACTRFIGKEMTLVGFAEMLDVSFAFNTEIPTEDDIETLYRYKTARYTFSLPFVLAAIVNNKTKEEQLLWGELGENIGILFQIRDDYLGIWGDTNKTGKPVGNDIREKKKTLFIRSLFESLTSEEKEHFNGVFAKAVISEADINWVLEKLDTYAVAKKIQEQSQRYLMNSKDLIQKLTQSDKKNQLLTKLLEFIVDRTK